MSRNKRKTIHKRIWLCPRDSDTMSHAAYTLNQYGERGDMSLDMADCSRKISMYFEANAKGKRKLDRLIKFLQEAQEKYDEENTDSK